MSRGNKPANLDYVINLRKLKEFRRRAGLSLKAVQEATGILPSNLSEFERGRIMLQFHKIKHLIELYGLDVFEVLDILRLRLLDPKLLRDFRRACRQVGTTPAQALRDFLVVFVREARNAS
uniref:XRE family transcriptional regulator n=1 Tax=Desulfobacca acetoxidans TaxID=60893 RepID=A0A7C3WQI3_9BACT